MKSLILAAALFMTVGGAPVPPQEQYLRSNFGMCPDGQVIQVDLYDTDKDDPQAMVAVYKRGEHVVAVLNVKTKRVWVAAVKREMDVAEAQQKWPTPCDLPDGTEL